MPLLFFLERCCLLSSNPLAGGAALGGAGVVLLSPPLFLFYFETEASSQHVEGTSMPPFPPICGRCSSPSHPSWEWCCCLPSSFRAVLPWLVLLFRPLEWCCFLLSGGASLHFPLWRCCFGWCCFLLPPVGRCCFRLLGGASPFLAVLLWVVLNYHPSLVWCCFPSWVVLPSPPSVSVVLLSSFGVVVIAILCSSVLSGSASSASSAGSASAASSAASAHPATSSSSAAHRQPQTKRRPHRHTAR